MDPFGRVSGGDGRGPQAREDRASVVQAVAALERVVGGARGPHAVEVPGVELAQVAGRPVGTEVLARAVDHPVELVQHLFRGRLALALPEEAGEPTRVAQGTTVTGSPLPSCAARASATARSGSSSSAAPAPVLHTLGTGQPMLRSIRSAPASATCAAAERITSGSWPNSCMATGPPARSSGWIV